MALRLPTLTPKKVIKALQQGGFVVYRQSGSHVILVNEKSDKQVVVPFHSKDLKRGLLHSLIKQAGLTTEQFLKLL